MPHEQDRLSRRQALLGAGAAVIGWGLAPATARAQASAAPAAAPPDAMLVTLLGTGSPVPRADRYSMSTLIQAGGLNLVFDAGRGCTIRLNQVGVALGKVDAVFITHFHSDHLNGLPDLWMTSYLPPSFGRRTRPLDIYGPPGIGHIAATMRAAFADDVRIRLDDEHVPDLHTQLAAHEFAADGVVFERDGVTVTAFAVEHGPLIKPSYGYHIDYRGRSVLISGDTRFDENLIAHGQGVDLLVHEVASRRSPSSTRPTSGPSWTITPRPRRPDSCSPTRNRAWRRSATSSSCRTRTTRGPTTPRLSGAHVRAGPVTWSSGRTSIVLC